MKLTKCFFAIVPAIVFVLSSCSIEKRIYFPGFHIVGKKLSKNSNEKQLVIEDTLNNADKKIKINGHIQEAESQTRYNADTFNLENVELTASNKPLIKIKAQSSHIIKKTFDDDPNSIVLPTTAAEEPKTNSLALIGFICSILGLTIFFTFIGSILAIAICSIALSVINNNPSKWKGRKLAIAGLILGILELIATIVVMTLWVLSDPFAGLI